MNHFDWNGDDNALFPALAKDKDQGQGSLESPCPECCGPKQGRHGRHHPYGERDPGGPTGLFYDPHKEGMLIHLPGPVRPNEPGGGPPPRERKSRRSRPGVTRCCLRTSPTSSHSIRLAPSTNSTLPTSPPQAAMPVGMEA